MQASFGAFWRIEQLLISTTAETLPSHKLAASGLPPIVVQDRVHDHIKWLFAVQAEVDALSVPYTDSTTGQSGNATLASICFKPLGGACAIESVLQYWQMDAAIYTTGRLSPDFCFGHWSTQCRSAFESPIDPHTVLGGFATDSSFRSFAEDATSFVVTYPVDSSPANRSGLGFLTEPCFCIAAVQCCVLYFFTSTSSEHLFSEHAVYGVSNKIWHELIMPTCQYFDPVLQCKKPMARDLLSRLA